MDTQRADYLTMYGHEADTSPNLQAFADDALVFDRAFAAASSTSPSHASIFTSTYPQVHGVWNRVVLDKGHDHEKTIYPSLGDRSVTMAEALKEGDYQTVGICDGGNLQVNRGMAQGFDYWDSKFLGAYNRVEHAKKWFSQDRDPDSPFFMFLHTYQVHTPYLPEPKFVEMFADPNYDGPFLKAWQGAYNAYHTGPRTSGVIRDMQKKYYNPLLPKDHEGPPPPDDLTFIKALYQAEIRQMDDAFGQLVAWLKANDLYEDTLIVVTSDHGEEFWEHGTYGHHQVYDPTLHVPLIIRAPGGPRGERRDEPVELIDLMPTLVYHADLPPPPGMQGRILDLYKAYPDATTRDVIGESNWPEHQVAVRVGDQTAVAFPEDESKADQLFDNSKLPRETVDIAATPEGKSFLGGMHQRLDVWRDMCAQWQKQHNMRPGLRNGDRLSKEEREEMIALGYLDEDEEPKPINKKVQKGRIVGPRNGRKPPQQPDPTPEQPDGE